MEMPLPSTPWFRFIQPRATARLRLFCFPYVGGGASFFRSFTQYLSKDIEVWPVQLPGRENRFHEAAFSNLNALLAVLEPALRPHLQVPYAFFGHSMGALISFELARVLQRKGTAPPPTHLFVSGHRAPQVPEQASPIHTLPEAALLERLLLLEGVHQEALKHPELSQMFLTLLRADFTLCETYSFDPDILLDCPISAFGGLQDKGVPYDAIKAWKAQTQAHFKAHFLAGSHFFVQTEQPTLLSILNQTLLRYG